MTDIKNRNKNLFTFAIKNIRLLVICTLFGGILAVVFSSPFFIQPKFKSEAAIYPSNLMNYSGESETEQLLQFFFGNDIRDSVISKFNLINHYDIDTSSNGYRYKLFKEFNENITIEKTKYESVQLEVLDTDPILAKNIAEEIINQVNKKISTLHHSKAKEVVVIRKDQLNRQQQLIDTLEAKIKKYSVKYGLLDYTQQSRELTKGYMNMLLSSKKGQSMIKVEELYENLKKEGRHFEDLHQQLTLAREEYSEILIKYNDAVKDVYKKLTYTNTLIFPEVADKKSYPVRWLIVVISVLGSFFFTFTLLLFYNRLKQQ